VGRKTRPRMTPDLHTAVVDLPRETPAFLSQSDFFQTALETLPIAMAIADRKGRIVWLNQAFTDLTGYAAPELVGRNLRVLKSGQHAANLYRRLWSTVRSGRVWQGEITSHRKDGSSRPEEITISPLRDATGAINFLIASNQNIPASEAARYQSLADSLPQIIFEIDLAGKITFANANTERVLGYSSEDFKAGLTVLDITAPHERERAIADLRKVLSAPKRWKHIPRSHFGHRSGGGRQTCGSQSDCG
jgi:PAS domain S-box-containing protein